MGYELQILKLFCDDRELYEKYFPYIKSIQNLDKDIKLFFDLINKYYDQYKDCKLISYDDFIIYYNLHFPSLRNKEVHLLLIRELFSIKTKIELIQSLIEQVLEKHYSSIIINKLYPVIEGDSYGVLPEIKYIIEDYIGLMANPPEDSKELIPNELSLEHLLNELNNDGLSWHVDELNNIIGKLKKRTLGLVYAYVDSGKTSFGLAAAANFAKQLVDTDDIIVYAGNEESSNRLNIRLTQALLKINRKQIIEDISSFNVKRKEVGFDKIKLFDDITTIGQIEKLFELYHPSIMFIDQATNIDFPSTGNEVALVKSLFRFYRNLTKKYNCSIIGLTQGVGDAENKRWLDLSDIYGSRVAIQGAIDYGIGIGRIIDDVSKENQRFLNIPKNKLFDGEGGKVVTTFKKDTCSWESI